MNIRSDKAIRFGDFELDKGRRILRSVDGEHIPLSARVFDTLLCMVERPGELVDKRELMDTVWPNVVVEENNLTQAISALRRALGEQPREHRYIVTVPGRGYRFVASIRPATPAPNVESEPVSEPISAARHRQRIIAVIAIAVCVAAILMYLAMHTSSVDDTGEHFRLVDHARVTERPANHRQPTLSPDGSMVAYVSDESGTDQLYVQNLVDGGPHQVTDMLGGAEHPSWSPRNDRIIFYSQARGGIWSVGTLGDPLPRLLIPEGKNPTYSIDGSTIIYEHESEIRFAESDGSHSRSVPGFTARGWLTTNMYPSPSPDGRAIVVLRAENTPLGDYWVVPVDGSEMRQLTADRTEAGRPFWAADGYVYFASERAGTRSIWRVAGAGGDPQSVTISAGIDEDPTVSKDGTRLVYANTRLETRFVVWNPRDDSRKEVYRSLAKSSFPMVSHDKRRLAFFQKSDPEEQLFLMDIDEWEAVQLTRVQRGERRIMPRWSPDDAELLFYEVLADQSVQTLRTLPVDGGPSREVFAEFPWILNMDIVWSPGGEQVVFIRRDPIDPMNEELTRVVVRDVASGHETEYEWPIAYGPAWSADGQQVLGASTDEVLVCTVANDECQTVFRGLNVNRAPSVGGLGLYARWSSDESRIFFNRRSPRRGMLELWAVDRDGGNAEMLIDYGPVDRLDGRFQVLSGDRVLWNELIPSHQSELWSATLSRSESEDAAPTREGEP